MFRSIVRTYVKTFFFDFEVVPCGRFHCIQMWWHLIYKKNFLWSWKFSNQKELCLPMSKCYQYICIAVRMNLWILLIILLLLSQFVQYPQCCGNIYAHKTISLTFSITVPPSASTVLLCCWTPWHTIIANCNTVSVVHIVISEGEITSYPTSSFVTCKKWKLYQYRIYKLHIDKGPHQ